MQAYTCQPVCQNKLGPDDQINFIYILINLYPSKSSNMYRVAYIW